MQIVVLFLTYVTDVLSAKHTAFIITLKMLDREAAEDQGVESKQPQARASIGVFRCILGWVFGVY